MYFCHNMLSFCPIHMKPTPKCSLFNSLSSNMVTNVALVKVCALPSARSSYLLFLGCLLILLPELVTGTFCPDILEKHCWHIPLSYSSCYGRSSIKTNCKICTSRGSDQRRCFKVKSGCWQCTGALPKFTDMEIGGTMSLERQLPTHAVNPA